MRASPHAATAATAEEGLEDVAEVAGVEAAALAGAGAAPVVVLALLGVGEDVVGVRDGLEPFGGLRARVHVGVQLTGELAVRLLDLFGGGVARDTQCFVMVSQKWLSSGSVEGKSGRDTWWAG
jgi:hypothetical protein